MDMLASHRPRTTNRSVDLQRFLLLYPTIALFPAVVNVPLSPQKKVRPCRAYLLIASNPPFWFLVSDNKSLSIPKTHCQAHQAPRSTSPSLSKGPPPRFSEKLARPFDPKSQVATKFCNPDSKRWRGSLESELSQRKNNPSPSPRKALFPANSMLISSSIYAACSSWVEIDFAQGIGGWIMIQVSDSAGSFFSPVEPSASYLCRIALAGSRASIYCQRLFFA